MHAGIGTRRLLTLESDYNYIMTYLPILCVLALTSVVQVYSQLEKVGTIVQNKNINIIVNMDPHEIAKELWKVIKARLNDRTSHFASSNSTIQDLEKAVIPLLFTTRRGVPQSAFQVASQLDKITRRALTRDTPNINLLDKEIMTRDIVADMMTSLKMMLSKTIQAKIDEVEEMSSRIHSPDANNNDKKDEKDDYVNVIIEIRRKDLLKTIHNLTSYLF